MSVAATDKPIRVAASGTHPSGDNRFKMLETRMKRYQHQPDALIEVLHAAQELFGFLENQRADHKPGLSSPLPDGSCDHMNHDEQNSPTASRGTALVVGYGNSVRGDDAAGHWVARAVEQLGLPGVQVRILPILAFEVTDEIVAFDRVVFVDAGKPGVHDEVKAIPVEPRTDRPSTFDHALEPSAMLGLARVLHGKCPRAWVVTVPGEHFGFSETLSPKAEKGVAEATELVRSLLA